MADRWMDGFDHYGTGEEATNRLLQGPWAEVNIQSLANNGVIIPPFGARNGDHSLVLNPTNEDFVRRVTGADLGTAIVSFGYYIDELPNESNRVWLCAFGVDGTECAAVLFVQSDGQIEIRGPSPDGGFILWDTSPLIASSVGPAITTGTWHHIEASCTVGDGTGAIEVRVDGQVVIDASGQDTGTIDINQMFFGTTSTTGSPNTPNQQGYDDIILRDTLGGINDGFEGDLGVGTLTPIGNGAEQGWEVRPILKLDIGVMDMLDNNDDADQAIAYDDNAVFELGSDDYTIEGFFRWNSLLTGDQEEVLLSKWSEDLDLRSWRLERTGPDVGTGNELIFQISTDGAIGTVADVHTFTFIPELYRWYHIAITREGTDSRLFIDGQQIGATATDSATYFDGAAQLFINNQHGASDNNPVDGLSLDGWFDGINLVVGTAIYTANFTPPIVAIVPDANSELVLNFDDAANIDDSANAFVGTLLNSPFVLFPNDGIAYQTVGELNPEDANLVQAALVPATSILETTVNPLNTEQVVLGAETYTFVTVLSTAFDVLIGATAQDSLDNLVAAVNLGAGIGGVYGSGTTLNMEATMAAFASLQALATARTPGAGGNSIVVTETLVAGFWTPNGTMSGGADIPEPSEFQLSGLPAEVTAVKSVMVVVRAYKLDTGASGLTLGFIENGGAMQQGSEKVLSENNRYWESIFNTDSGSNPLTPSDLVDSEIEIDRTT